MYHVWPSLAASFLAVVAAGAIADDKSQAVAPGAAGEYAATAAKRAAGVADALGLNDAAKSARVQQIVAAHYIGLHDAHNERDAAVKVATGQADKDAARVKAAAAVKAVHEQFLKDISQELTPAQVEIVKDKMTYNVVPVTYKNYGLMLPALTDEQKTTILDLLKQGREEALVAGNSNEKHEKFGRYKGKITNYLSAQGYDLKKAGQEWAERRKAADAAAPKK